MLLCKEKRDGSDDKMGFWYIFTNQWINIVIIIYIFFCCVYVYSMLGYKNTKGVTLNSIYINITDIGSRQWVPDFILFTPI